MKDAIKIILGFAIFFTVVILIGSAIGCGEPEARLTTLNELRGQDIDTLVLQPAALKVIPGRDWLTDSVGAIEQYGFYLLNQDFTNTRETIISSDTLLAWLRDSISGGGSQTLTYSNDSLYISGGNAIVITGFADTTQVNEVTTYINTILAPAVLVNINDIADLQDSIAVHRTDINAGGGGGSGDAIKVTNYTELRTKDNTDGTIAMVIDSRTRGVFYYDETAGENGGTEIGGNWRRMFDGTTFHPEWWEVGGYNSAGTSGGILNECDAVRSCFSVADTGATISFYPNKTYEMDIVAYIKPNQYLRGNGATIKRKTTPVATLSNNESIGSSVWEVDDATGFRVGQRLMILDVSAPNGGLKYDENAGIANQYLISGIDGNTITVGNTLTKAMSAGDEVIVIGSLLSELSGGNYNNLIIEHLNVDGNRDGNDHTLDWRFNYNIQLGTGKNVTVRNCNFYNASNENMTFGSGVLENCDFRDMNGSGFHISSTGEYTGTRIFNCTFTNMNEGGNSLMYHSEAAITYSANAVDVFLTNCKFINGGEGIIGNSSAGQGNTFIRDCYAENFKRIYNQSAATTEERNSNFVLSNNVFKNCGDIIMAGYDVREGNSVNRVTFTDNIFVNNRMYLRDISQSVFDGNMWLSDTLDFDGYGSLLTAQNAFIQFQDFDQIQFTNNQVIGPLVNNDTVRNGVLFNHANVAMKISGVDTDFLYSQNIKIEGNTVANFTAGITSYPENARTQQPAKQAIGWDISNNTVYIATDVININNTHGIYLGPGYVGKGNTIYMPQTGSFNSFGMIILGASANADSTDIMGAIALNNVIYGPSSGSGTVYKIGNSNNANYYNCVVMGNVASKALGGNTSKSQVANNIVMGSTDFSNYTAPQIPIPHGFEGGKEQY